ncbi:MAG: response regulator [Actinomycetes bacterium]
MRRALIVDDAAPLRLLLRHLLQETGRYEVVAEAGTGTEAVEAVRAHHPDVVLLDLSMPVMDGLTALPLIREASPTTRVVVLTGYAATSARSAALAAGADGFVEKGTRPAAILAALDEAMEDTAPRPGAADRAIRPQQVVMDPIAVVGQLAHDLRSPLLAANGLVRLLDARVRQDERLADVLELTAHAVQALTRAEDLLDATLRYVREGLDASQLTDVGVGPVVEALLDEVATGHPGVAVHVDVRGSVRAEPAALSRVLGNLLRNAASYAGRGVEVLVTDAPDDHLRISVVDRGPGFSDADADRLFTLFARGSASAGRSGSGMGLAVSAKLVERMGGRLWAENRPGGGAAFHVELPAGESSDHPGERAVAPGPVS